MNKIDEREYIKIGSSYVTKNDPNILKYYVNITIKSLGIKVLNDAKLYTSLEYIKNYEINKGTEESSDIEWGGDVDDISNYLKILEIFNIRQLLENPELYISLRNLLIHFRETF